MKICQNCKKEFDGKGKRKTQRFCSRQCSGVIHHKPKKYTKCPVCGEVFVKTKKSSKICSRTCSNKATSKRASKRNYKHGMRYERFYTIWHGVMLRCLTPTSNTYKRYGAKGIIVCNRWKNFKNFKKDLYAAYKKHAKEHGEKNTTLDRIDGRKGYTITNCRWATWSVQAKNKLKPRERNEKGQYI